MSALVAVKGRLNQEKCSNSNQLHKHKMGTQRVLMAGVMIGWFCSDCVEEMKAIWSENASGVYTESHYNDKVDRQYGTGRTEVHERSVEERHIYIGVRKCSDPSRGDDIPF